MGQEEYKGEIMKALLKTKPGVGNLEVLNVPKPEIVNSDDVLIRITAAGICGTDMHIYHDMFKSYPPVILGHEFAGVVEEVGSAVTRFAVGDRVTCEPHTKFCGKCDLCRAGKIQLCKEKRSPGWGINGSFTDYIVVPELFLHHIPDNVSDEVAALSEPMAIVTHSVLERAKVEAQEVVAIIGAGPIGLLAGVAAKAGGAKKVYILGTTADVAIRFTAAMRMGFDGVINTMKEDATEFLGKVTNGKGVDMVIEASGAEAGINTAIDIVKMCGRICVIGMPGKDKSNVKWLEMTNKALDVYFNKSSSVSSWEKALSIMATTNCDLRNVITHYAHVDEWEAMFDAIAKGNAIKVMFVPEGSKLYNN